MKGFDKAQRAYDAMMPDEPTCLECFECGALLERNGKDDGWDCPDCDFTMEDQEADYEDV